VSRIKDLVFGDLNNPELLEALENQFSQMFQEPSERISTEIVDNQGVKNEQNSNCLHQG